MADEMKCECPARKALEDLLADIPTKDDADWARLANARAALAAPCPCAGLREENERLRAVCNEMAGEELAGPGAVMTTCMSLQRERDSLRAQVNLLETVEKYRLCIVPPNQETSDWSVYADFDGEFGYDNEIGTGVTLVDCLEIAIATISDTEDVR